MNELLVAQAGGVIVFSAITGLVFTLATAGAIWVFIRVFDDYEGNVRDVQRFIELTDEARSLVPSGLPLLDWERAAATTAAIGRFQAKKDEARRALWDPRTRQSETPPPATTPITSRSRRERSGRPLHLSPGGDRDLGRRAISCLRSERARRKD
jgi:hypothetical protein